MPKEPNPSPRNPASAPPPSEADSSPVSERASQSEPASFIGDAGPQFDPEVAAASAPDLPPPPADQAAEQLVQWEADTIEALLSLKGRGLHAAIGVAEEDWRYTELDLAAIAPPLTRICNRYEPIQRLAKYSDPMTLAFALGAYGVRSLEERQRELQYRAQEEEGGTVPIAPAEGEPPAPPAGAPSPATAPRQAAANPTAAAPPPAQPGPPAPPPPPRPAEAPIDPTEVNWEVGG